jgi:hypothetical protein
MKWGDDFEPHPIGNEPVAGEAGRVCGILALLNPLLCCLTPVAEVHHTLRFGG